MVVPRWPEEPGVPGTPATDGRDWRDTLRGAADLALLGILTTLAALPLVTAGAAVATASASVHQWTRRDHWPAARDLLRTFGRALLPGAAATLVAAAGAALLTANALALAAGVVPGGTALVVVTALLGALACGLAGMIVVQVGRQDARNWREATRVATRAAVDRPVTLLAATGTLAFAAVIGTLVLPLITPILAGYVLFALHALARRLG